MALQKSCNGKGKTLGNVAKGEVSQSQHAFAAAHANSRNTQVFNRGKDVDVIIPERQKKRQLES